MAADLTLDSFSSAEMLFSILPEDLATLYASSSFKIIRKYLADSPEHRNFCTNHSTTSASTQHTHLLHRDILHALLLPVSQLFDRTSALASAALCTRQPEDLELAYRGDARSAYLWLQCTLAEEEDWCRTRGCPTCVVANTLATESTVRLGIMGALLSQACCGGESGRVEDEDEDEGEDNEEVRDLPSFIFFLETLRAALSDDPFWGPDYWTHLLSKTRALEAGMRELIQQAEELETLIATPMATPTLSRIPTTFALGPSPGSASDDDDEAPSPIRLRKSGLAKRQQRIEREQQELLQRLAWQLKAERRRPEEGWPRDRRLTSP